MNYSVARSLMIFLLAVVGLEIGAGLYEARVLVPLWADDPQAAYRFFAANRAYSPNAGPRWWIFLTPLTGLIALLTAIVAGKLPPPQSRLVRIAALMIFGMTVITFTYFVPTILLLQGSRVLTLTAEQAKDKAGLWATLNWGRAAVIIFAWAILIRGVSLGPRTARA